jgi:hypothetical protein
MRLIDADALLEGRQDHEMISTHLIWNAPTVDAVPVVRCRDCMHRNGSACDYSAVWVRKNGFCQWGERKHDEDPSHPWADSVMMGD